MIAEQRPSDELAEFEDLIAQNATVLEVDPEARRARRRRALTVTALVVGVVLVAAGLYVGWALNAPLSAPALSAQAPQAAPGPVARIVLPAEGASAISISGADEYLGAETGGIRAASGTNDPRSIASITKLITALVVLEAKPLASADDPGPTITFSEADHDLYDTYYSMGATIAAMPAGSRMSQRDALATMLVPSACNYAEAVSTWAYGSQARFLAATRDWLAAHGLTGTTIVEPTGISARNTSTPSDILALGRIAAAHPAVAAITATRSLALPGPGTMRNTNSLLGVGGVTGLKTGNLGDGRFTLVYTASLDVGLPAPIGVTGVALDGGSRDSVDAGVRRTLGSIRDGFHDVAVSERGQRVGSYSTPWGSTADVVISDAASIFTWSDTPISVSMDTTTPAEYEDGAVVGSITWTAGPHTVTSTLEIEGNIDPADEWWRLTHPTQLG